MNQVARAFAWRRIECDRHDRESKKAKRSVDRVLTRVLSVQP